jgi:hypothetical protein
MTHIPTAQAQQQGIPGSDVFRFSHLLYHDSLNRDAGVVQLNAEALKAFCDTVLVANRHAMANERNVVKSWLDEGGFASGTPVPVGTATYSHMHYINYENLKIACGFELHLKARLLANDYVVHKINARDPAYASVAAKQKARPVPKGDLFAISSYLFDGTQNYLPGLSDESLKFSHLTDERDYRKALDLPDRDLDIIKDYRNLRNQIHLPGDGVEAPAIQAYNGPIADFLVTFINTEIIPRSNTLIARHNLNWQPLVPLS